MKLYRMELDDEFGEPYYVEASPAELLEAARPHADLEAAMECEALDGFTEATRRLIVGAVLTAALGADDESWT